MSISIYDASVGVFVPFLDNLSGLLDHAGAYAEVSKIDPAILLGMRLYPNMYNLAQQVGEANRHAIVACALLAGREPQAFPEAAPDLAELTRRIAAACEFIGGLPRQRSTAPAIKMSFSGFATASREASAGTRCS